MHTIAIGLGLTIPRFKRGMGQKGRQNGDLFVVDGRLEVTRGGDQFLQVLDAVQAALAFLLFVVLDKARMGDGMFEQFRQWQFVDRHAQAIDQV